MRNSKEVTLNPNQLFQGFIFPIFIPKTTSVKMEPTIVAIQTSENTIRYTLAFDLIFSKKVLPMWIAITLQRKFSKRDFLVTVNGRIIKQVAT